MIGFESTKSALLQAYHNNKLHHAILLHGKKGIGKASFAKELVNKILSSNLTNNPDIFVIEKDADKKEIGIDKIRSIKNFAIQTSAISHNKFIIIDSACELNKASSNALLKILEEPRPNNFLILISHNLNRILPTVLSRCLLVRIPELSREDFYQVLQQNNLIMAVRDLEFLSEICDNSPAQAINLGEDLVRFYELFLRSIINKKISEELHKRITDKNFAFAIFENSAEFFFNRLAKCSSNIELNFYFEEEKVFLNLIRKFKTDKIFELQTKSLDSLRKTTSLSLDKKLCITNIFNSICYN